MMKRPCIQRELFLSKDVLQFIACLGLSILIAGGVMGWLNEHVALGASWATRRAEAFAAWYCARPQQNFCHPHLLEATALPASSPRSQLAWRFRFQLSPNRNILVRVNPTGRVHLEIPSNP